MADQANELRELVRREAAGLETSPEDRPWFLAVGGGRDGVGTTTVALGLAVEAAQSGRRVLLVDADANRGDVASLCRLEERDTLADVLAARRSVREAIQPGPAGIWVLAGGWAGSWTDGEKESSRGQFRARLVQPLKMLGDRFDLVVIDAGNGANSAAAERWQSADAVLLVTTTDLPSIMDAYATIKNSGAKELSLDVHCLVNMAADKETARDVHARLAVSCRRFLGLRLEEAGNLPADAALVESTGKGQPVMPIGGPSAAIKKLSSLIESLIPVKGVLSRCAG